MHQYELDEVERRRAASGRDYLEFLRFPQMSAGLYKLAAGAADKQKPHNEDEMYYVVHGRAMIHVGGDDQPVQPGTAVFVPAQVEHRFHSITEDLTLLVVFAPAEGARA